ncbi:MAG: hypothetical protein LBK97_04305 [Prevotellaceae bacterium]|nr:hypothetical protein [Prevotellaceae bacterium]
MKLGENESPGNVVPSLSKVTIAWMYDKISHFNSPQGMNINRNNKAIDTVQLR